jgi:hypothetical protein
MELDTPGGFELFFKEFGPRLRQGPIGLDELNRLGEPHGIRFFNDWIPTSGRPTTCASSESRPPPAGRQPECCATS